MKKNNLSFPTKMKIVDHLRKIGQKTITEEKMGYERLVKEIQTHVQGVAQLTDANLRRIMKDVGLFPFRGGRDRVNVDKGNVKKEIFARLDAIENALRVAGIIPVEGDKRVS